MLNYVVLIGRLGKDPELRYTTGGHAVSMFSIAVDRAFNSANGDKETDWLDIVAWREQAQFASNYLYKGRLIAVVGRVQIRNWTAQDGTKRRNAEIVADRLVGLDKPNQTKTTQGQGQEGLVPATFTLDQVQRMMTMMASGAVPQIMEDIGDPEETERALTGAMPQNGGEDPFANV